LSVREPADDDTKEESSLGRQRDVGGHTYEGAEHQSSDCADHDCGSGAHFGHPIGRSDGRYAQSVKRSAQLAQLSRDHHQALAAALKLRRAGDADAPEAVETFLGFWREHGQRHFQIEEDVLLPGFALGGGDPRDERVARVLTDHVEIRARALRLSPDAPLDDLHELGEQLTAHVRLEEDELFPLIEQTLEPETLAALGEELERAERAQ
jgi:hemerythrin-like domain-containing protein